MLPRNINILNEKKNKNLYEYKPTTLNKYSDINITKTTENETKNISESIEERIKNY